jgi:proteasome lid subunit RPN8/RPN11
LRRESFFAIETNRIGTFQTTMFKDSAMKIHGIRQKTLSLLLQIAKESHPNEFVALLRERDGFIDEVNLLPGTTAGEDSARMLFDMMPLDTHLAGSAHSHPSGAIRPSNADVNFFPRTGKYHLIIGFPYSENDWKCFTADGEPYVMDVVT